MSRGARVGPGAAGRARRRAVDANGRPVTATYLPHMGLAANGPMRVLATTLIVLGLALAALPATAQTSGQTSFTLTAKAKGGDYVWADANGRENPTLTVPASQEITIVAQQDDQGGIPHNIKVGNQAPSANFQDAGDSVEYKFTSPASGTVQYICTIHPGTMKGTISVAGADGGSGNGGETGDNDSPSLGVLGALVALAGVALLLARRG